MNAPPGRQEEGQTQQLVEAAGDFGAPFGFEGNAADNSGHGGVGFLGGRVSAIGRAIVDGIKIEFFSFVISG